MNSKGTAWRSCIGSATWALGGAGGLAEIKRGPGRDEPPAGGHRDDARSVACRQLSSWLGRGLRVIHPEPLPANVLDRRQQHGRHRQRRRLQLGRNCVPDWVIVSD
jgi:hypothetical protein